MGYNYLLDHSVPSNQYYQPQWEFCVKCHGMFFNGNSGKGRCPGTIYAIRPGGDRVHMGSHERLSNAYHFLLRFQTAPPPPHGVNYACGWPPNPSVCPGY